MLIINDDQFIEGIFGGLGRVLGYYFIRESYYKKDGKYIGNPLFVLSITWALVWYIRKVGMNLYKQHKLLYKQKNKNFNYPFGPLTKQNLIILMLFFNFCFLILVLNAPNSLRKILTWNNIDLPLIIFIVIIAICVYSYGIKMEIKTEY